MNSCMRSSTCWTFLALISLFLLAAACGTAGSALETLAPSPRPPGTPIPATSTSTLEIPTPPPTATEAMALAPQRPALAAGAAVAYSAEQDRQIEAGAFARQEQVLAAYYQYWAGAASSPVHPPAAEDDLFFIYVFNPEDAADACLAIAATGYFNFEVLSAPYVQGRPQTVPPEQYVNGRIETDQSPLLLNNSGISIETGAQFQLSCQAGRWVRRDASGVVMERINQQGRWEVVASWLAARYNLNPDHQYSIVTVTNEDGTDARYLRDEHNQAYKLMFQAPQPGENPQEVERWIYPGLEAEYGHLVPENEGLYIRTGRGNRFFDTTCSDADINDTRYKFIEMGIRPTGNFRVETATLPGMDRETINLYGGVVFRDDDHTLRHIENVRFDVIDPDREILLTVTPGDSNYYMTSGRAYAIIESVNRILEFYDHPGRAYVMEFVFEHPNQLIPPIGCFIPNARHQANYQDYLAHTQDYQRFAEGLLGTPATLVIPEGLIIPAQFVRFIDTYDTILQMDLWHPPGN